MHYAFQEVWGNVHQNVEEVQQILISSIAMQHASSDLLINSIRFHRRMRLLE